MSRRGAALALVALAIFAPLHCRKADAVERDPIAVEAEEALIGYIRIDTTNPPGNETAGARYLAELFAKNGIEARLLGEDPRRQGVYARLSAGAEAKGEKALLLLSHIDVVPAVAEDWTKPPFSGLKSEGYIWGRGSLDMKSLAIAELMAMVDLKRRGIPLRRDVIFLASPDEELGGLKGTHAMLQRYPELFRDVGFALNEGGSNDAAVDRVLYWAIEVQQKVPLWVRLHADGLGGHGAGPPPDGGTAAKLVRALAAVEKMETPYHLAPDVATMFAAAGRAKGRTQGAAMLAVREPLDPARVERELSPGYRILLRDTVTITRISAGNTVNVIPSHASADLDIRLLPDSSPEAMLQRLAAVVGSEARLEVLLRGEATPASSPNTELFQVLSRVMQQAEPGSHVAPVVGAGTTDSRFFRARGVVAYGISPFKVNYYDADGVHGTDERMRTRFFAEGVQLMRNIVREFCGQ